MADGKVAEADLELPCVGETYEMSEREDAYYKLLKRMKKLKIKTEDY